MSKNKTTFGVFESKIVEGDKCILVGWWGAAEEAVSLKLSASAYAAEAVKVSKLYTADSIRVSIGYCLRAMKAGWGLGEFVSFEHLKDCVASLSTKKGKGKIDPVQRVAASAHNLTSVQLRALLADLAEEMGYKLVKK